jgi:3-oxoacyl-[acyl-carrier protein] reductase
MVDRPVALVTGASGGIGRAVVDALIQDDYYVVAAVKNHEDQFMGDNLSMMPYVSTVAYDVNDSKASREAINNIKKTFGRLDVAINNAGILRDSLLGMLDDQTLDDVINVNSISLIRHMRDESRLMMRQGSGVIINLASVVGLDGNIGQVAYSSSKGAVIAATKSAAKELAPFSIRVNAVAPGLINTKMLQTVNQDKIAAMVSRIPLKRLGTPKDVASLVSFLVSEKASYITGQIIRVDGGFVV